MHIRSSKDLFSVAPLQVVEGNYKIWHTMVEAVLIAKELWDVVGPPEQELVAKGVKAVHVVFLPVQRLDNKEGTLTKHAYLPIFRY